jgi:hypothetical protein
MGRRNDHLLMIDINGRSAVQSAAGLKNCRKKDMAKFFGIIILTSLLSLSACTRQYLQGSVKKSEDGTGRPGCLGGRLSAFEGWKLLQIP